MGLGILCLETYWSDDPRDRRSARGLLELLEQNVDDVLAVHRHVATRAEFEHYLAREWTDTRYDLLYIAAHGDGGGLFDERGTFMSMRWLGNRLTGSEGRVLFLAGCGTFAVSDARLDSFVKLTGAAAVAGYAAPVDWLEAAQMDLIVLSAFAEHGPGATGAWHRAPLDTLSQIVAEHKGFTDRLKWQYQADDDAAWEGARRALADGAATATAELVRIAADGSVDHPTRQRTVEALGALADPSALTTLTAIGRDTAAPARLRRAAIGALADIPGGVATNALRRLARRLETEANDGGSKAVARAAAAALASRA
jgi:hypothetical protein